MSSVEQYIVFGPLDTLKRLSPALINETKPKHSYAYESDQANIHVSVFEEAQKLMNTSTGLTCITELSERSLKIEIIATGGRMGFRGSASDTEIPITEQVKDFILDFTKRFGLTIQDNSPVEEDQEEETVDLSSEEDDS